MKTTSANVQRSFYCAFFESFSLFGVILDDYDKLFEEKLGLFMELQEKDVVNWHGEFRSPFPHYNQYMTHFMKVRGMPYQGGT